MRIIKGIWGATLTIGLTLMLAAGPALAHHGKDFLLLETDDMPEPGTVYLLGSVDTNLDPDGTRSTEITPGLLFGNNKWAFEPHFHLDSTKDEKLHYDATAMEVRYRIGNIGRSEWRAAVSGEVEVPRASDAHSDGLARLDFVRTYPNALVAINLLVGREFSHEARNDYSMGLGVLTPISNTARVGVEVLSRFPVRDGLEIVPGYYTQLGKSGAMGFKVGVGYYHSQARNAGTLHVQLTQRF
ncbi:MAG: hypothetical protein JO316_18200 [Abitibacteriaceae bacterium]|nr:hypothetical protein [Abditibacteriaceae bacterium]